MRQLRNARKILLLMVKFLESIAFETQFAKIYKHVEINVLYCYFLIVFFFEVCILKMVITQVFFFKTLIFFCPFLPFFDALFQHLLKFFVIGLSLCSMSINIFDVFFQNSFFLWCRWRKIQVFFKNKRKTINFAVLKEFAINYNWWWYRDNTVTVDNLENLTNTMLLYLCTSKIIQNSWSDLYLSISSEYKLKTYLSYAHVFFFCIAVPN